MTARRATPKLFVSRPTRGEQLRQSILCCTFAPACRSDNWHSTRRSCGLAGVSATANCQAPTLGHTSGRRGFPRVLCAARGRRPGVYPIRSKGVCRVLLPKSSWGQSWNRGCINLAEVTLSELPSPRELVLQARVSESTPGCLSSTGITALALPMHFVTIGAHACDSCRLLKSVDLCNTNVEEISEFAFVHCTSLREVFLPTTLHTIRVKAFMNCAALVELAIPPSLRYIGSLVGLSRCQEGINGEESMQKRMLSPFVLLCDGHLGCT